VNEQNIPPPLNITGKRSSEHAKENNTDPDNDLQNPVFESEDITSGIVLPNPSPESQKASTSEAERILSRASVKKSALIPKTISIKARDKGENTTFPPRPTRNWYKVAKKFIQDTSEREAEIQRQRGKLCQKSPSIMFGPCPDLLEQLDKPVNFDDTYNAKLFKTKKPEFRGLGIPLGESCFLGLKAVNREDIERAVSQGHSIPLSMLSCDF